MKRQKIFLLILYSFIFPDNFHLNESNPSEIVFSIGNISFEDCEGHKKIISDSEGVTQQHGAPELPSYSMNYAIDADKEYDVNFTVTDYEVYDNISIYPFQSVKNETKNFLKDEINLLDDFEINRDFDGYIKRNSIHFIS